MTRWKRPLGKYKFGEVTEYNNIEINVLGLDYGDYTLTVTIYVEGGSYPIPTNGKDYQGLQNITNRQQYNSDRNTF